MFMSREGNNSKSRFPRLLELNKHHQDYNMMHRDMRHDINFNSYLELVGLKGGVHGQRPSIGSRDERRDLQYKISKVQVPTFDGKKMVVRAWVYQLQSTSS